MKGSLTWLVLMNFDQKEAYYKIMISTIFQNHLISTMPADSSGQRKVLRDFLSENLDAGTFPGVSWISKEERLFRIPWLHKAKRNWTEDHGMLFKVSLNTLRRRQNGRHFTDNIYKCIFLNETLWILIKISLKFLPYGPVDKKSTLVQVMAWCWTGNKPLPQPVLTTRVNSSLSSAAYMRQ